jgi:type IV secretion system protein VirB10
MTVDHPADGHNPDGRPVVGRARPGAPPWVFAGVAIVGALALFVLLDSQRRQRAAPTVAPRASDQIVTLGALPPLVFPPEPPPPPTRPKAAEPPPVQTAPPVPAAPAFQPPQYRPHAAPPPVFQPPPVYTLPPSPTVQHFPPTSGGAVLVIDTAASSRPALPDSPAPADSRPRTGDPARAAQGNGGAAPVHAGTLRRPSGTIAQGVLIPAVLETALDSSRPGLVRAVVSRDVASFDGARILIPRGSRLVGDYAADLSAGQNRALITWTRLVRPDGVTIALDSPAADLRGRAGVPGRVDGRFLQRFGQALLQTVLDIGAGVAAREIGGNGGLVIALPRLGQTPAPANQATVQPVLRVEAGARASVMVARDLELPAFESLR